MFYAFTRPDIQLFFNTDPASGQVDEDFLECALLRATQPATTGVDMWRVSTDGKATLIREYWEDHDVAPGSCFSPNVMV